MKWIEVKSNLPKPGVPILAFGLNGYQKRRTLRAFYAPRFTIEDDNEHEAAEYCEEKDNYFLHEGWYENNEYEEVHWMIDFPVTHWMPLPEPPECLNDSSQPLQRRNKLIYDFKEGKAFMKWGNEMEEVVCFNFKALLEIMEIGVSYWPPTKAKRKHAEEVYKKTGKKPSFR